MSAPTPDCPEKNTLVDFLLGKLPESDIQVIEDHLSHCPPCGDTVRLLDNGDTLDELARQVMLEAPAPGPEQTRVDELIQRIQTSGKDPQRLTGDVVDRSAEVTMLLAPSSNPDHLGCIAHYEVVELLGAGGTGVVYKATDTQLQRVVALKILRPSLGRMARERFLAEARAAAAIDHEQVMTIYHVGEEEPLAWIAMQWIPGETLEQRLRREPVQDDEIIASVCRQMAQGLAAAHQQGLIHRDIKPANIWIESGTGRVKILDFGLARVADDDPQFTDTGMIAGTPTYMSPEQTRGAPIDHRSDLFSLGCVLHRMATGHLPFQADNVLATLQCIQRYQPPHASELNPAVSRS
ncbi:MAG: protein kinase domain-containing protein, partial [Pirellulaceae bacterium]